MPSTNKTTHFGLNNWSGTDKPKRSDFVEDNVKLDTTLHSHFTDNDLHFTAADREKFRNTAMAGFYGGTGEAKKSFALSFAPKGFFVFQQGAPLSYYDPARSATVVNSGFLSHHGGTAGMSLSNSKEVHMEQSQNGAVNGVFLNLNEKGKTYLYLAVQ